MKLVIKGEITAERLTEILAEVAREHGARFGGFYSATFMTTAYRDDGLEMEDIYRSKWKSRRDFPVPRGTPEKPALNESARQLIKEFEEQMRIKEELAAAARAREKAEIQAELQARREAMSEQTRRSEQFRAQYLTHGSQFLDALNAVIEIAWRQHKPKYFSGKNKGQTRALPKIAVDNGRFIVQEAERASYKRIATPLSTFTEYPGSHGYLPPLWFFYEWTHIVVPQLAELIESFGKTEKKAAPV